MREGILTTVKNQDSIVGWGIGAVSDVVIFGQSAGAVMTAQYGALMANPDYKKLFHMSEEPRLALDSIRDLVIDDAPLDIAEFHGLPIKLLIANYLDDSVYFKNGELSDQYNAIAYVNESFPRSFLTAGTDDGFPDDMQKLSDRLTASGVENVYFYRQKKNTDLPGMAICQT